MKKTFSLSVRGICLLIFLIVNHNVLYSQKKHEKNYPIPDDVLSILKPFCFSCHGPEGGRLPHSRLNFAIWTGYSPGKQADKAAEICSSIKKGTMPTKLWKQQNPEMKLTQEMFIRICDWAASLKSEGEKGSRKVNNRKSNL